MMLHNREPGFDKRFWDRISERVHDQLGSGDDAFVAVQWLWENDFPMVRQSVPINVPLGVILPAMNFDPLDDHPDGFEFEYAAIVIDDFEGINDELDTVEGAHGDHFSILLDWKPKLNSAKTARVARLAPGHLSTTSFRDSDAARVVAERLAKNGYDAVLLAGYEQSCDELEVLTSYANQMRAESDLVTMVERNANLDLDGLPFSIRVRTQNLPRLTPLGP